MPFPPKILASLGLFFLLTSRLLADGGVVQFRHEKGPFIVTLFSTPSPLRSGPADLSVLIESATDHQTILDASVSLHLKSPATGLDFTIPASHEQATNKLLYAALPDLPTPGDWRVDVLIQQGASQADVHDTIHVLAAAPVVLNYWPYFAAVPCLIGLFVLNQWLKSSARRPNRNY